MKIDYGNPTASSVGSHVKIAPVLENLMLELHHRMPRISYVVKSASLFEVYGVEVFHDYERVGAISVEHHTVENVEFDLYTIKSSRIKTKRKAKGSDSNNIKKTKLFKSAVRIAMDVFKRTEPSIIAAKIASGTGSDIESMVNNAVYQARGFLSGQYKAALSYLTGATLMSPELTEAMKVDGQSKYDNLRIAEAVQHSFNSNYGVCIRTEKDGTITVVNLNPQQDMNVCMEITSTYDLPANYQEKFAILKIMEYKQPIEHVGVKFEGSPDLYFLVGGETITTC